MSSMPAVENVSDLLVNRRSFLAGAAGTALATSIGRSQTLAPADAPVNLAKVATPSSLYTSGDTKLTALNDGLDRDLGIDVRDDLAARLGILGQHLVKCRAPVLTHDQDDEPLCEQRNSPWGQIVRGV